jgi:alpha-tubulin suppressor-like RCC1 family protein
VLRCWGANYSGQLGNGTQIDAPTPIVIRNATVVAASKHTCAIDPQSASKLYCWGDNSKGQIGNGSTGGAVLSPTEITSMSWSDVAVGFEHTCAATSGNNVYCWGAGNRTGTNISDPTTNVVMPTANGVAGVLELTAGAFHTCAVTTTGTKCWGDGYAGQLGTGDYATRTTPATLPGTWRTLGAGEEHTCGIQDAGTLWCWGDNQYGQLGTGNLEPTLAPVQITSASNWVSVAGFVNQSCAVNADDELYCWGENNEGQLATGNAWTSQLTQIP